jgi:hypothetical protein
MKTISNLAVSLLLLATPSLLSAQAGGGGGAQQPQQPMGFFITSVGKGDGANLGGLAGADAHCAALAQAAGTTGRTWRAYLSTTGGGAVNARDRIGNGPWYNKAGQMIAASVAPRPQPDQQEQRAQREGGARERTG